MLWSTLRNLGNSTPAKLTIFIPLIGYMIIFNKDLTSFLNLIDEMNPQSCTQSKWLCFALDSNFRLYLIYFGLFLVGIATGLYQWFCPKLIKDNTDYKDFITSELPISSPYKCEEWGRDIDNLWRRYWLKSFVSVSKLKRERETVEQSNTTTNEEEYAQSFTDWKNENQSEISDILTHLYNLTNIKHPLTRILVSIFYAIGIIVLMIPSFSIAFYISILFYQDIIRLF